MANVIDIILRGKNEASTAIKQVKGDLTGLDSAATSATGGLSALGKAIPVAAIATAALKVGEMAVELGNLGQQVQQQRDYFEVWSGGVAAATTNLEAMRRAVGGAMTESEMLSGANRLLSMGLADNANELENMSRMAVMLGGSTRSASESIEEFSLLLANQSILRLDTFGISGAKVRQRIEELQAADENLSREQAFLNAVMEEGTRKVEALEAAGVKATTATQDLSTAFRGLKEAIGEGLAAPVAEAQTGLAGFTNQITSIITGSGMEAAAVAADQATNRVAAAEAKRAELLTRMAALTPDAYNASLINAYQVELDKVNAELQSATDALNIASATFTELGGVSGVAAVRMVDAASDVEGAIGDVNSELSGSSPYWDAWAGFAENAAQRASNAAYAARSAMGQVAQAATTTGTFTEPSKTRWGLYTDYAKKLVSATDAGDLVTQWQERMERANEDIAGKASSDYVSAMNDAARQVQSDIEGALSGAISASKGLFDFTGGATDIFKPGSNGPFEAIYRAQAVAVGGIETDQERQWAEMYGLTPESAARIVADFQRGLFTPEVQGLINVDQLVGQIQSEQAAAESKTAFANMIAGKLGVKDAGALVASQTFQAISGGVDADPTQQADAAQKVLDAYLNNVNSVVTGKDYAGRMIAFGTTTWVYYEQGLLEGAKESVVFAAAVDAAIGAWMARQQSAQPQGVVGAAAAMGVAP